MARLWDAIFVNGDPMHPQSRWTWSPQLRNLVGFATEAEFPNVATSWSERLHPDDIAPTFEKFGAALKSGSGYELTRRIRRGDAAGGPGAWSAAVRSSALAERPRARPVASMCSGSGAVT